MCPNRQAVRILIKMPWEKENVQKVQPPRYLAEKTGPWGGQTGLEPPQVDVLCPKSKIYVKIAYAEHFPFYCKKNFVCHFLDFV